MNIDTTLLEKQCKKLWPDVFGDFSPNFYGEDIASLTRMRATLLKYAARKCGLCKDCSKHLKAEPDTPDTSHLVVWGDGLVTAPIFVIGNTMDFISEKSGLPFASHQENNDAGVVGLNTCIKNAGLLRHNTIPPPKILSPLYITHTRKCPGNMGLESCWRWLQIQLFLIQPIVIIAMGSAAADSLRGKHITTKISLDVIDADLTDFRKEHRIPDSTTKVLICSSPNIVKQSTSAATKTKGLESIESALKLAMKEVVRVNASK